MRRGLHTSFLAFIFIIALFLCAFPLVTGEDPGCDEGQEMMLVHVTYLEPDGSMWDDWVYLPRPSPSLRDTQTRSWETKYTSSKCNVLVESGNANPRSDSEYESVGQFF